jgi:ribosome recycling factor
MQDIMKNGTDKMNKAIENLEREFGKLRTGRASSTLFEELKVDYYGTPTPMNQLASISIPDSRTVSIQPWDKGAFPLIEKAIQQSDLGLTPVNDGKIIRISVPPLTEERRKELVKVAKKYSEDTKVAVRNIRRDMIDQAKKLEKAKEISEDDLRKAQDDIQKLTDGYVKKCDDVLAKKDKEIMEI